MQKSELSANQKKALVALLASPTIAAAAARCGLSERTLYNYLADDVFKTELRKRQDAVIQSVTAALVGLSTEAVATLRNLLRDPNVSSGVKCRAALGWLAQMRQSVELADLAERVSKLEEATQ